MVDTSHPECHWTRIHAIREEDSEEEMGEWGFFRWRACEGTSRSSVVGAQTTCCKRNWTWAKCRVNAARDALSFSCSSRRAILSRYCSLALKWSGEGYWFGIEWEENDAPVTMFRLGWDTADRSQSSRDRQRLVHRCFMGEYRRLIGHRFVEHEKWENESWCEWREAMP